MMERRSAERDTTDMRTKRTASAQGLDRSNEGKHLLQLCTSVFVSPHTYEALYCICARPKGKFFDLMESTALEGTI
jgi:hypothetical protein